MIGCLVAVTCQTACDWIEIAADLGLIWKGEER